MKKRKIIGDYFWNTMGSVMNAASSVLMLLVVTRILGVYAGGVFSLAYAVSQQFQTVGAFEMRPYQATDLERKFPFSAYLVSRFVTTLGMMLCVAIYCVVNNGFTSDSLLLMGLAGLKIFDVAEDVFHGELQRNNRLDKAGQAYFFRVFSTTASFIAGVIVFRNLGKACIFALVVSLVVFVYFNCIRNRCWIVNDHGSDIILRRVMLLLKYCLPLCVGAFLAVYLSNAPRFAIEDVLTKEDQAVYSILFMPALVINLLSQLAFRPLLTSLASLHVSGNQGALLRAIARSSFIIFAVWAVLSLASIPFGMPVLGWLYAVDLSSHLADLLLLLVGGALNALGIIVYYVLVTERKQMLIMTCYAIAAAFSFIAARVFVATWGITGACLLYLLSMLLLCFLFLLGFAVPGRKQEENRLN